MKTSTSAASFRKLLAPLCAAILSALLATSSNAQTTTNTFSSAGTTNWVCPPNVFTVNVECWGAGGAGGGARGQSTAPASRAAAGGGAGGAYARSASIAVTPGTSYTVVVGSGGVASTNNGVSVAGGDSWFSTQSTIIAKGGAGANSLVTSGSDLTSAGGSGSTNGSIGDVVFAGGNGAAGFSPSATNGTGYSGGGGSSGGISTTGNNASTTTGGSAPAGGGAGANGRTSGGNAGIAATQVGGGGGGAWAAASTTQRAGGSGAAGQVRLVYTVTASPSVNTTGSLIPFSTEAGTASAVQTFNATGANLTQNITVTAPADFEIATDGATFGDTATITQSGGSASGTISVRIKATATVGAKSGNIILSSAGATDANVPVSGTVNAVGTPVVNLSTSSISNLSTSVGIASAATNYVVTGTNLGTTNVTITPSQPFLEIGTNGSTFSSTVDLSPTDGAVSNTVFLRVAAANVVTNYNATISHVSGSASNSLAVTGAITNLPPVLSVSTNTLSGFTTTTNVASAAQTFTVTGSNLTTNVSVGAPTGFQVANDGTTWDTNTTLAPVSGIVSNTVFVRMGASSVTGPVSGNVTVASTGVAQRTVAVNGLVESPSVPGQVYWNFNSATPTSGTNGEYAAWTFGPLTQGNNLGTTTLFTSTSASSGYTNPFGVVASGSTNAGAAARTGAFNADSNAFFEVQVVVPSNTTTLITNISFGSRSTGTGPAAYSIRSSADGFAVDVATNALTTNSAWTMNVAPVAIALSNGTNRVRIYGYAGSGNASSNTANWRIDDLTLALAAGDGPTPIPPTITSKNAFSGTVGVAFSNDITATGDAPIGFSGTSLPGGLSVASGGAITGTPTAAGTFNATLTATNTAGTNNQAVIFTISKGAVSITTPPTASSLVQGQALLDSFLSGGSASVAGTFAWTDPGIIPPVGTTSYGVTFTPTDAANYDTAATNASVTVLSAYQAGYSNWLTEFQLDPQVTSGPTAGAPNADPDNDGFSNASEYAFGTNPTVPNGALLATSSSNSVFRSSWAGPASGVSYAVQFSTNLSTMTFSNDPTITIESVGGVMSFTNQATGNKFFRVRATSN